MVLFIGAVITWYDGHHGLTFSFAVVALGTLEYYVNWMLMPNCVMPYSDHVLYWVSTAVFSTFMIGYMAGQAIFSLQSPSIIHRNPPEKSIVGTLNHSTDDKVLVYELANYAPTRIQCVPLQQSDSEDFSFAIRGRTRLLQSKDITDIELCFDPVGGPGIFDKIMSLFQSK